MERADSSSNLCKEHLMKTLLNKDYSWRLPFLIALIFGLIGASIEGYLSCLAIQHSSSSTAAIEYIFLPFSFLFDALFYGVFGFLLGIIVHGINKRKYIYSIVATLIIIPASIYLVSDKIQLYQTFNKVHEIAKIKDTDLLKQELLSNTAAYSDRYGIYIIAAIAQNPYASAELLDKIAHLDNPQLNDRLGSTVNLTPGNNKGLAAIRLVVLNPNVSIATLDYLSDSKNYYLLGDIAANNKVSADLLRKLYKKSKESSEGYLILYGLRYNHNTPPEIAQEITKQDASNPPNK